MTPLKQDSPKRPSIAPAVLPEVRKHDNRVLLILKGMVANSRRWLFQALHRRRLFDSFKTLAVVSALTLMIWVWAETQQLLSNVPVAGVELRIVSKDRDRIVSLREPSSPPGITLRISGPKVGVGEIIDRLTRSVPNGIELDLGNNLGVGTRQITIIDRIKNLQPFKDAGVSVIDVVPALMIVDVDRVAEYEVDIKPPPEVADKLVSATFDPARVKVRGPASVLTTKPEVYADLRDAEILKQPGDHPLMSVVISARIRDERITLDHSIVQVKLQVKGDAEWVKPQMPIYVSGPPGFLDQYKVEFDGDPFLLNVKLLGPPDTIAQMQKENFRPQPYAQLVVERGDETVRKIRPLQFINLPQGVTVSMEDSKREKAFKLVPRE